MNAEKMGKISYKLRLAFTFCSILFVIVLAISPVKDSLKEWKTYKKDYVRFAQTRPDTKQLLSDFNPGIDQIWIPEMRVIDRCTTCHQGISQQSLQDQNIPQPFRSHPKITHNIKDWGCVICHRGQGVATEAEEAHKTTLDWEQPLLPIRYIQASCGVCHHSNIAETPRLNRGRQLLAELNCNGCHKLEGIERPAMLGPDLSNIASKVSQEWIYKWLKEPRTILDKDGNTVINGYENDPKPRMPQFRLNEQEIKALSAYLSTLKTDLIKPYKFDPAVVAAWQNKPDIVEQGQARFREMFCTTCHSVAVTRAGETKLIGGEIAPELTKIASKVNPDWLVAWLKNPQEYMPNSLMPRYEWSDEDLFKVTQYITSKLTDSELLSNISKLEQPSQQEIQTGRRLFTEKGCASCHVVQGINLQKDFGPDLSAVGSKTVSQLDFGNSKIQHDLISYLQAKIAEPLSMNPTGRMPKYNLSLEDSDALITALLSMTGKPSNGLEQFVVSNKKGDFRPAGSFGEVYKRYKCYVCHSFNGYGGTLATDLSFEGSRAQKQWMIDFLKKPQTLRPTLIFRMPQFNMTDQEATIVADYLTMVFQTPLVKQQPMGNKAYTTEQATTGKQLYEVKYQCQACHTIGSTGGYVGPNLSNVGNWLNASWIEEWLREPQLLLPNTIEPKRQFTQQEIEQLTAYLLTLKQAETPSIKGGQSK